MGFWRSAVYTSAQMQLRYEMGGAATAVLVCTACPAALLFSGLVVEECAEEALLAKRASGRLGCGTLALTKTVCQAEKCRLVLPGPRHPLAFMYSAPIAPSEPQTIASRASAASD